MARQTKPSQAKAIYKLFRHQVPLPGYTILENDEDKDVEDEDEEEEYIS